MKAIQIYCRVSLLIFFAVAWWMFDCAGELTVARTLKEKSPNELAPELQRALHGCGNPEVAAELTPSLREFALLLPTAADRAEMSFALQRDYLFMAAYALAYLGLAALLYMRVGVPGAALAASLTLITVACDLGENYHTFAPLQRLQGDYRLDGSMQGAAATTPELEGDPQIGSVMKAKSWCSRGKWIFFSALNVTVAFVFLRTRRFSADLAGLLLALGGIIGVIGSVFPAFIGWSVLMVFLGAILGTCILLGPAYWERLRIVRPSGTSQKREPSGGVAMA